MAETDKHRRGRVIVSYGAECIVEDHTGGLVSCQLRRRGGRPVCGDFVDWHVPSDGSGVIERIRPRHSLIERGDFRGRPRPLAANVDRMIVVAAVEPGIDNRLIDRYLVLARHLALNASLWINKADRLDVEQRQAVMDQLEIYRELDVPVTLGSAHRGDGIDQLRETLAGHCGILVGHSGAGKSSLVNALVPDLALRVGTLSRTGGQGRHTTTATTLFHLPTGGELIDSPGVRTLRLDHLPADVVTAGFPEIAQYLGQCRFRDCRHDTEPGCAINAAVERGAIRPERMESLRYLLAEAG
ncbi:MAG TPA: ribosome small subunit-dependent GTPase A [Gammaproteobacteria bacterium]|nr:ribosome small subunit-dependent GTPase A [Gammaproteobacteria bacterium]